jgi:hypothetical protein
VNLRSLPDGESAPVAGSVISASPVFKTALSPRRSLDERPVASPDGLVSTSRHGLAQQACRARSVTERGANFGTRSPKRGMPYFQRERAFFVRTEASVFPAATLEDAALCYVELLDDPTSKVCASPPLSAAERLRLGQLVLRLLVEEMRAPPAGDL